MVPTNSGADVKTAAAATASAMFLMMLDLLVEYRRFVTRNQQSGSNMHRSPIGTRRTRQGEPKLTLRRLRRLAVQDLKLDDARQQRPVLRQQIVDAHREPADLP